MLQWRRLNLALLWVVISVEGVFASVRHRDNWNNWIILQARSRASDPSGNAKIYGTARKEQSGVASSYINPVHIEPYILTISEKKEIKDDPEKIVKEDKVDTTHSNELVLPISRAIEKVKEFSGLVKEFFAEVSSNGRETEEQAKSSFSSRKIKKTKKKFKKFIMPLLLAYKLKFLTLIPVLIGGLLLLVGTTGLAGFFFALFTAVMSLKGDGKVEFKQW